MRPIPLDNLPSNWRVVQLGEAIELVYGKGLPRNARVHGKVPVYGSNGIAGWNDTALVNDPTIIVGRKGSAGLVQFAEEPCYPIDTTYFVRVRPTFSLQLRFLFYLLRKLDLSRLRTATGVPGLTREDAYKELIPVPPLHEQQRIADILSRAEGIVRLQKQAADKAREIIPALFLDMFGDPATNPKGWNIEPLGMVTDIIYRYPTFYGEKYVRDGVPVVRIGDIGRDSRIERNIDTYAKVQREFSDKFPLTILEAGDLVMAVRGDTTGKLGLVPNELKGANISANLIRISPATNTVDATFLLFYLKLAPASLANFITNTAKKSITARNIKTVPVLVPALRRQQEFAGRVAELHSIQSQAGRGLATAEATLQSLLHCAFEGQL